MAVVALAVIYPIGYGLWHSSFSIAALPLAIAGAIWLMLRVSKPRWVAAEPLVARYPRLAGLIGVAALLAIIAGGSAAVGLLRTP
jgi:hypothetical protein